MSRVPTSYERELKGENDGQGLIITDSKQSSQPSLLQKYSKWMLFDSLVFLVAFYILYPFNSTNQAAQYAAIALMMVSSILIYGSFNAGTKMVLPAMAYVPGTGAIDDVTNFRQRMFSNYTGPLTGIIIGVLIFIITILRS